MSAILDIVTAAQDDRAVAEAEGERRREAGRAEKRQQVEAAEREARALLGALADECDITWYEDYLDEVVEFTVRPRAWDGRVDFAIRRQSDGVWFVTSMGHQWIRVASVGFWQTGLAREFIAALHARFEAQRKNVATDYLDSLRDAKDEDMARLYYRSLMGLAPERQAEWDRALTDWLALRQAEEERQARRRRAFEAYIDELREWHEEYNRILEENWTTADRVQAEFNEEFTRCEIGIAPVSPDGQLHSVTGRVWATADVPDDAGYYHVYAEGGLAKRRLAWVWIGEPITEPILLADEGPWYARASFPHGRAYTHITCLPWRVDDARRRLRAEIKPLPEEPPLPERFQDGLTTEERSRIQSIAGNLWREGAKE